MEMGDKVTRAELTEQGWVMRRKIPKTSSELWTKDTWLGTYEQSIIWRVKTRKVHLIWDKKKEV